MLWAFAHSVRMQTAHKLPLAYVLSNSPATGDLPVTTHAACLTMFETRNEIFFC